MNGGTDMNGENDMSGENLLISIIIPVYNSSAYLKDCLDSLVNQTYQNLEIITINDGSTDNSLDILFEYKKNYPYIHIINKPNGGQATARNAGLKVATGDYISFIDSDDYVEPDMYEKLLPYLTYDIICYNGYTVSSNKEKLQYLKSFKYDKNCEISQKDYMLLQYVGPWNKIIKKDYLKECNFYFPENIIYEDYASLPALVRNHPSIFYVNETFYYYVQTDTSTIRHDTYSPKMEHIFPATTILYESLKDSEFHDELEYMICYHCLCFAGLNFFRYKRFDQLKKLAKFIKSMYPNWEKNPYLERILPKNLMYMKIFYHRLYRPFYAVSQIKKVLKKEV